MAACRRFWVLSEVINATKLCTVGTRNKTWSQGRKAGVQRYLSTQTQEEGLPDTVQLSDSCVKQLKQLDENGCLRVIVESGGCSGFQYKFDLDATVNEDDHLFEKDGAKVVVDTDSLDFLKGCTIDFHEELIRSAFRIINNPRAEQGCSCGASFAVKL
ncbi:iron-sulfur cluster assembly 2 homolog, mitochondrial-like [Mizuhopecten yessoensis]|uniref:Iron-sulfur cluster assembly 2 homolog, mitochondrial n=1 Tax=Mizuhopecten yessoensis TaxID=6573 RepID=A0A210QE09_MIZYE|nr:iron-sulfur cluster assembly 2 homolog, mitochondrial-like [Mizuhopecten yessoensis]OWF46997.1 Iron-sulfur cluster assembly 2-like [Mizuhopecten yessoensis]